MINRFSSRRQRLDHAFLNAKLQGAQSYKRIAGYFRSSIFELVGEAIAAIPDVRIVCNSATALASPLPRSPELQVQESGVGVKHILGIPVDFANGAPAA